ncbi:class I SAM-dependent methyltransferase [Sphingoaurantiacus capsulatus]|uniref:Class I SAM-dependent methyltransferase n=1 Tax=Sphingoaurantiacus capsulatus TaxID=1771310 RepID=A0ABV7X8G6_9SPHN
MPGEGEAMVEARAEESGIREFWQQNPCGETLVDQGTEDWAAFFATYDEYRYRTEGHILGWLDYLNVDGLRVLEIGLGQGADAEQLIRRGARWTGIDLTAEAAARTRRRLEMKGLQFDDVVQGSARSLPFPGASFDLVYSWGVLHHIPEIGLAQAEIARVLKPGGRLAAMLYAKHSLNYWLAITVVRRLALILMRLLRPGAGGIVGGHLANARRLGMARYLRLENFIHANTDGPGNPYSKVYEAAEIERDFDRFDLIETRKDFMHAPPLPVRRLPFGKQLGWHLMALLTKKPA